METNASSPITEFIRYNNWANEQILEICAKLNDEQLNAPIPGGYGSIRDTLEHTIRAEAGYVMLLTGSRPQPAFKWEDKPGLTEMTAYAKQVGEAVIEAVSRIAPTDMVQQEWQGKTLHYRAMAVLIQIVNHGVEHRTNITTALNQIGQSLPGVDGWGYLWANPEQFDVS